MNLDQAKTLIRQTFTQGFDKTRFRNFVINLLNGIDESKASSWSSQYIKNAFKGHIYRYERLGTYTTHSSERIDVLIVHLTEESKLERTRTAIRNFVADHLKTRDEKDAALVAFVSPTEKQWRFSYVKMEYATVEKESGRVGVETRLTPARRFSYIVGEGESCHTAQTRFIGLLQDTQNKPKLTDIETAFSVEAITKEFFNRYVILFMDIQKALEKLVAKDVAIRLEFKGKNISAVDFAKKLLGQIVFLYFLQKKGWLGVEKKKEWGSGPRDFLRKMANREYGQYDNFFNDLLEPLFYDTLATDRGHEAWCKHFQCRIPFLNGGLFEPIGDYDWSKYDILLPNRFFTNNEIVEEGIIGTGILDVFDRYNFTVNEAEPLEKEVAVDPEMLGKVFENLIEENRRKGIGAYYTPREIVHYMCQESLINYLDTVLNTVEEPIIPIKLKQANIFGQVEPEQMPLKTTVYRIQIPREDIETFIHLGDQAAFYEAARVSGTKSYPKHLPKSIEKYSRLIDEKLFDITVCDPAVGSGAFPVGMMHEIVRARCTLTPYFNDIHERTPYHFKRQTIQNSLYGVDIDTSAVEIAKLRLWLSLVVDEEDVKQIKPLPNLDYKIVSGNSLLGVEKNLFNEKLFRRLEELKPLYFDESHGQSKDKYKREIDRLICELTDNKNTFDFEIYFSEVFHKAGGFDVVIANPPYVGEKDHKEMFRELKQGPLGKFYQRKMDIFYFFFHLALNIGSALSHVAFITTNYYPTATGAKTLRKDFSKRASILRLANFNELRIFKSAQGQHNMITVLRKEPNDKVKARTCITKRTGVADFRQIENILGWRDPQTAYYCINQANLYEGSESHIRLSGYLGSEGDETQRLLAKLKKQGELLGSLCNVSQGTLTGVDRITKRHVAEGLVDEKYLNHGVYILKKDELTNLNLSSTEQQIVKPFFKNSDIQKYVCNCVPEKFIIYATRDLDINQFPNIKRHFGKFESVICARSRDRGEMQAALKVGKWWVIFAARTLTVFMGKKIVCPQRSYKNTFAYNEIPWHANTDVYFIVENMKKVDLKFVLSLLNSKLYYTWLYHKGQRKGELLELLYTPLTQIPIKCPSPSDQMPFIKAVDNIIAAKQRDPQADTTTLEQQVDRLVYDLYGLTPEEIKIVEGKA
jgi:type I restriction-modification system DNA methylase subunit